MKSSATEEQHLEPDPRSEASGGTTVPPFDPGRPGQTWPNMAKHVAKALRPCLVEGEVPDGAK